MKRIIVFLAMFLLISCNSELDTLIFKQFQKFINKYKKHYSSINEYLFRYQNFKNNLKEIFNSKKSSFKKGINQFSDLTKQEFSKTYLNLNLNYDIPITNINLNQYTVKSANAAPASFDWRDRGKVGTPKDQGNCGSSWAFATMGNLEAYINGNVISEFKYLSTQMLVDCDTSDSGCNGGMMQYAYTWLKKNNGIMLEKDYPYTGVKGACKYDSSKAIDMKVTGYFKLGSSSTIFSPVDEDEIKEYLYQTGPLAIALNGNPLMSYESGVIDVTSQECPSSGINVCALLVGYGTDSISGLPYWIVKNSWGESWGESGYFRIRRGANTCCINCYVFTGIVSFN